MSTKKFVTIIAVALIVFIAIVGSVAFATAESKDTYEVDAVVVNFDFTPWGDIEVEVFDEDGNLWGYYTDEDICIGDVVTLTVFDYGDEEENEIIDAVCVDHFSTIEMLQWIRR